MFRTCKSLVFFTGVIILLSMLVTANTPALARTAPPQPSLPLLQQSAHAMSNLKSVVFDLKAALKLETKPDSIGLLDGLNVAVTGQGEAVAPDKATASISLGQTSFLHMIRVGPEVYVQDLDGTWYELDKSQVVDNTQNFFSESPAQRLGTLLSNLQDAKITDHGLQTLNGTKLDHISIILDQMALQLLNTQATRKQQQEDQQQAQQATLDLWIDPATAYIHQANLHTTTQIDLTALPQLDDLGVPGLFTPAPLLTLDINAQLDFSKFNQPLQIQAPQKALPLPE